MKINNIVLTGQWRIGDFMSVTFKQPWELIRQFGSLVQSSLDNSLKPALNRAGLALSRESGLWPTFSLGLHFCAMQLALAVVVVGRGTVAPDRTGVFIHLLTVPLAGLALTLALRRGGRLLRLWPVLLAGGTVAGLVWMFTLGESGLGGSLYFLPVALALTVNWPVGLWLFFQTRPERAGLPLGLAMASGEMIWILLVPLLSAAFTGAQSVGQVLYLSKTLGFLPALSGLSLTLIMVQLVRGRSAELIEPARPEPAAGRRPLFWLFVGGVCFFVLFGLAWGAGLPRSAVSPVSRENLHYFLLFGAPLAGWLLDRERPGNRRGLAVVLAALILAALSVPLTNLVDGVFSPASFILMNMIRGSFLLLLFLGAARLGGWRLPLWGSLAYSLYLTQFAGAAAGRALYGRWGDAALIAGEAGLVLALAFCLGRFWLTLGREPFQPLPEEFPAGDETAIETDVGPEADPDRAALFAAAFELTGREAEVLAGIRRGLASPALAESLGISQRTLKYHLSGLLKKTGQPNRRRLTAFYAAWGPPAGPKTPTDRS